MLNKRYSGMSGNTICGGSKCNSSLGARGKDNCSEKKTLMRAVMSASFVTDDLRLFLDTHPDCTEALSLFSEAAKRRSDLICQYTEQYGPLESDNIDTSAGWSWNCGPMPWEMEANC